MTRWSDLEIIERMRINFDTDNAPYGVWPGVAGIKLRVGIGPEFALEFAYQSGAFSLAEPVADNMQHCFVFYSSESVT